MILFQVFIIAVFYFLVIYFVLINFELLKASLSNHESKHSRNNTCTSIPANLVGRLRVNLTSPSWGELEATSGFTRLRPGGEFSPTDCDPEYSGEFAKHW